MRITPLLRPIIVCLSLSACATHAPGQSDETGPVRCSGNEILEVFNPLSGNVDIIAHIGAWGTTGQYFASAPRRTTAIPIDSTSFAKKLVGFEARIGTTHVAEVRIKRQCAE